MWKFLAVCMFLSLATNAYGRGDVPPDAGTVDRQLADELAYPPKILHKKVPKGVPEGYVGIRMKLERPGMEFEGFPVVSEVQRFEAGADFSFPAIEYPYYACVFGKRETPLIRQTVVSTSGKSHVAIYIVVETKLEIPPDLDPSKMRNLVSLIRSTVGRGMEKDACKIGYYDDEAFFAGLQKSLDDVFSEIDDTAVDNTKQFTQMVTAKLNAPKYEASLFPMKVVNVRMGYYSDLADSTLPEVSTVMERGEINCYPYRQYLNLNEATEPDLESEKTELLSGENPLLVADQFIRHTLLLLVGLSEMIVYVLMEISNQDRWEVLRDLRLFYFMCMILCLPLLYGAVKRIARNTIKVACDYVDLLKMIQKDISRFFGWIRGKKTTAPPESK
jgi:hypothetical protein